MSITREKNLWSGTPVWFSYSSPKVPHEALKRDIKADVIVIGAGVSGASVAQELSEQGWSVIILDDRPPACGSTSASTALLQYDLDKPFTKLAHVKGHEDAARAWRRSRLCLENLAAKTRALDIKCDLVRRDVLYLNGNVLDADGLHAEYLARLGIGLYTEYLDKKTLKQEYGIKRKAALRVRDAVAINPRKFVAGYLNKAIEQGAKMFSPVKVMDMQTHRDSVTLQTDQGYEVTGRYVVFATGYEVFKSIKLKGAKVTSSWAFATKPQKSKLWPEQPHIWEAAEPYLYIRTTEDGRVICGGEDEEFSNEQTRDALIPQKTKALQKKLKKLLPDLDVEADYAWAGCFGETNTSLPMIGPVPGVRNVYAILGWGGNGITFSRMGAEIIATMLDGRKDIDAELFELK